MNQLSTAASFPDPPLFAGAGAVASRTSSGSVSVPYPASVQMNDLVLLTEVNSANQAITTPAGWTLLSDSATSSPAQFRFTVWWKLAAGETSVALSVHTNGSGANAWALRYARSRGYPPLPTTATASPPTGTSGANATLTPSPDVTTNASDATVISLVAIRAGNSLSLSAPQSFTVQVADVQNSVGQPVALGVADIGTSTNPTTPPSPAWSQSGTAAQWAWTTIALA
jgi:hypothetical protein